MLKRIFFMVVILSLTMTTHGRGYRHRHTGRKNYPVVMKEAPKLPLTANWAFIIDTSSSMGGVFPKARRGFQLATSFPNDQLKFCAYVFNDENKYQYGELDPQSFLKVGKRKWEEASPTAFLEAERWAGHSTGVHSYGSKAIASALRLRVRSLTIILISDGGFSDGISEIKNTIREGQQWREINGFGPALITTIGIQNVGYTAGGKKPDADCQEDLRQIGVANRGGYFYVRRRN